MTFQQAIAGIRFRLIEPLAPAGRDGRFHLRRPDGSTATLIETGRCRLESTIVDLDRADTELKSLLAPLLPVRRMSTLTNGAVLNLAVRAMDPDHAFVNVGVWHGFTMLAAMAGNDDRVCVGIDNFSQFGGPREEFNERFLDRRSPLHRFHDQNCTDFFSAGLDWPLGVYFYDGDHRYESQYQGLMVADPLYADDAIVIVDDTKLDRAREATLQFARDSRLDWRVLLDQRTADPGHPTVWNGLMVLQAGEGPAEPIKWVTTESLTNALIPAPDEVGDASVSVVALGGEPLPELAEAGVEVVPVENGRLLEAINSTSGRFVAIAEVQSRRLSAGLARAVSRAIEVAQPAG